MSWLHTKRPQTESIYDTFHFWIIKYYCNHYSHNKEILHTVQPGWRRQYILYFQSCVPLLPDQVTGGHSCLLQSLCCGFR